jgi:hypothetical protein
MMFSKPRLVSIGLLLAILFISLMFTSYAEGLDNASIADIVNKDAPKTQQATDSKASATDSKASATDSKASATDSKASATDSKASATDSKASATDSKASATDKQKIDGVTLGKTITVADITGVLQNNPGVQKILNKSL